MVRAVGFKELIIRYALDMIDNLSDVAQQHILTDPQAVDIVGDRRAHLGGDGIKIIALRYSQPNIQIDIQRRGADRPDVDIDLPLLVKQRLYLSDLFRR